MLHQLVNLLLEAGDTDNAQLYLQRWLELDPLHEYAQRQYMRVLASIGRRDQALRQYERFANVLDEELGVKPAEPTRKLVEAIRNGQSVALREVEQITDPCI